ncbi:dihydrofolate reductase-like [Schistocerca gregaria]|uniref:dihydrofolate reductase-like n=1 Tax=Schistocerca gregaria TaxID=7010 RepID=UPI00211DE7E5|nr:dihydrofolate reductase-like [Schistocerca gregaria]
MEKSVKLDLIAAADRNMGIGQKNMLPWKLTSEFKYFLKITKPPQGQRNVIIVGHRTWETMGEVATRPFPGAMNIVISRSMTSVPSDISDTVVCSSLDDAINFIKNLQPQPYRVWVLGGAQIYKLCLLSPYFHRLYLTRINRVYHCDAFFPEEFKGEEYVRVQDPDVPQGMQTDEFDGTQFEIYVYERHIQEHLAKKKL